METAEACRERLQYTHLRMGWWTLCVFVAMGLVLEALHGLKTDWYLNVGSQTRRFMWTLAHTHGTLVGLVHLAFAATMGIGPVRGVGALRLISACLTGATLLLPGGFLLGGIWFYEGDPGLGIFLVPPGGVLLVVAVLLRAWKAGPAATD